MLWHHSTPEIITLVPSERYASLLSDKLELSTISTGPRFNPPISLCVRNPSAFRIYVQPSSQTHFSLGIHQPQKTQYIRNSKTACSGPPCLQTLPSHHLMLGYPPSSMLRTMGNLHISSLISTAWAHGKAIPCCTVCSKECSYSCFPIFREPWTPSSFHRTRHPVNPLSLFPDLFVLTPMPSLEVV